MRPIDADKLKAEFWKNVEDNACFTLAVALQIIDRQETIDRDERKADIYEMGFKDGKRSRMKESFMKRRRSGLCGMIAGAAWTAAILGAMYIGYSWIAPLCGSLAGSMTCAMVYYWMEEEK